MVYKNVRDPKTILPIEVTKESVSPVAIDAMEQISAETMQAIGTAKQVLIEILERIDTLKPNLKTPITERVKKLRAVLETLQKAIEKLMDVGEPKVESDTLLPEEFFYAAEKIKKAYHEPVVAVVDTNELAQSGIPFDVYRKFGLYAINWNDFVNFIATRGMACYVMKQLSIEQAKKVAEALKVQPAKNRALPVYYFAEKEDYLTEIISWEQFEDALKTRRLAIYSMQDEWLWVRRTITPEEVLAVAA